MSLNFSEQTNSHHSGSQFMKVRGKDICMGKMKKDMCPFSYWSVVNVIKVLRERTYVWAKAKRTCALLAIGEQKREIQNAQVNFMIVQRQKL